MNANNLTPEKSLQIISEIIEKSRKDFERNSGTPMVVWGISVMAVSAAVWLMLQRTGNAYWNYLWFAIPVLGYPLNWLFSGRHDEKRARSFLNDAIGYVWILFGMVSVLLALIACFLCNEAMPLLTPLIVSLLGFSAAATGMLLKNRVIAVGGLAVSVAGPVLSSVLEWNDMALLMGGAALVSLLIPGIMLNMKKK